MNICFRPVVVIVLLVISAVFGAPSAHGQETKVVPNQYIIQRKPISVDPTQKASAQAYTTHRTGAHFDVVIPHRGGVAAMNSSARSEPLDSNKVTEDCDEIMRDPTVESCEPNVIQTLHALPNDTFLLLQWGLVDPFYAADIRADIAWNRGTGTKDTLIGVIDSGIYWEHPDLKDNLWSNPSDPRDGIDNDGNGYVDDTFGIDAKSKTNNPNDCDGHGTHVSGIIGATGNNALGVTGVNWTTSLIVVSATDYCGEGLPLSNTLAAYDYFYDLKRRGHNIRIINASFGSFSFSDAAYAAISRLNSVDILVVAAAGNENTNVDRVPSYPAGYDLPNVISVGATGPRLGITLYTNYGQSVDILAPGGDSRYSYGGIASTYSPLASSGQLYDLIDGTSMAAPMVTGALGLLASQRPYLNGMHLKNIMLQSADELSWLSRWAAGGRFLNLGAMSYAPDPADNCPADPGKLEPGVCGCGTADRYVDSDSDSSYDCVDGCPSDPGKTSPGSCGCGIPDSDGNGNGMLDCDEMQIASITPTAPVLKTSKGSLQITIPTQTGMVAYVKVVVKPKRGKTKTTYYTIKTAKSQIKKLPVGATVTVQYAYMTQGAAKVLTAYSAAKRIKIKR
jgi:subtilisin family serine protease